MAGRAGADPDQLCFGRLFLQMGAMEVIFSYDKSDLLLGKLGSSTSLSLPRTREHERSIAWMPALRRHDAYSNAAQTSNDSSRRARLGAGPPAR